MRLYWSDNVSERPSATDTIERLSKPPFVKSVTIKGLSVSAHRLIHTISTLCVYFFLYRLWCKDMSEW